MGKGRYFGRLAALGVVLVVVALGANCGTSNDQGISFRATGWAEDAGGESPITGVIAPLACTSNVQAAMGLQNNMLQGIQVERADFSYRVSGSSLRIPNTSEALSQRLGPATGQESNNPPSGFSEALVVPANIIEFLNNNRNQLPDLPFGMTVTATAVGITDAGDEFRTNRIGFHVEWLDDDACESGSDSESASSDAGA